MACTCVPGSSSRRHDEPGGEQARRICEYAIGPLFFGTARNAHGLTMDLLWHRFDPECTAIYAPDAWSSAVGGRCCGLHIISTCYS